MEPSSQLQIQPKNWTLADDLLLNQFDPLIETYSGAFEKEPGDGVLPKEIQTVETDVLDINVPPQFDLAESLASIPNKLFFRIGDAAEWVGVEPYVLRFWETEFPVVKPQKSKSGQRVYTKKHVETLMLIKHLLYVERFSIEGARKRIQEMRQKKSQQPVVPPSEGNSLSGTALSEFKQLVIDLKGLAEDGLNSVFRY